MFIFEVFLFLNIAYFYVDEVYLQYRKVILILSIMMVNAYI